MLVGRGLLISNNFGIIRLEKIKIKQELPNKIRFDKKQKIRSHLIHKDKQFIAIRNPSDHLQDGILKSGLL